MKRLLIAAAAALLLASCGPTTPGNLYNWGGGESSTTTYEKRAYDNYHKQTPETLCAMLCLYERLVNNPGGSRQVPPPGICAEYGYLLLSADMAETFEKYATADQRKMFQSSDFAALFNEKGVEMLKKELALYPEAMKYLEPILKRIAK